MYFLDRDSRHLEDAFFLEVDRRLVEQLRQVIQSQERKEALKQISGIDDDRVLDRLVELDIRPESVASLSLVPLVEVAWADGHADAREKKAILAASQKVGLIKGEIDYELLSRWLDRKPGPELMEAWIHFVKSLCESLSPEEQRLLKAEIMNDARAVASASGGFLGIGKISESERRMLERLEAAFTEDCSG